MNVIVILDQPIDFGSGEDDRFEFVDAKYHVDKESGALQIISALDSGGNVGAFALGQWRAVMSGDMVHLSDDVPNGRPLTVVNPRAGAHR